MRRQLKYTLRLTEHIKTITVKHFELSNPFLGTPSDIQDEELFRVYYRDLISDRPSYSELKPEQKYLHDLNGLIGPILSAYRSKIRIPYLHPRTGKVTASQRLEDCGQRLAMDTFHFKERVSLFGESAEALIENPQMRSKFKTDIGRMIRAFTRQNSRLLRYRNFIVHGPKGRIDEFWDLRSWELGGIFLHNDLWLDYNNAFEDTRLEWFSLAKTLIQTMEHTVLLLQQTNQNYIDLIAYTFLKSAKDIGVDANVRITI